MAKIYKNAAELVGNTPLLEVGNIEKNLGLETKVLVKLEYFNPAGSAKDRIALSMIEDAEEKGILKPGAVIIEPTSGNTGIGLASLAAIKGYKVILTMPETMSVERRNILKAYGAEIVLTEGSKGMNGAIAKAKELAEEYENSFIPGQFENPANPAIHRKLQVPGDLERYRRTGRYLRSWCWYRRNDHRCWGISEIPESGCKGCGSRACNFTCTFSGKEWSA